MLEVISDHDGSTFRTVYTVKFERAVFVLHAFEKKPKKEIATSKPDIELVRHRLKLAAEQYRGVFGEQ
jgi:phage-related protein